MTSLLLLAVVVLPAAAAAVIAVARPGESAAGRTAVRATAAALLAGVALAVAVGADGPVEATLAAADGTVLIGLYADRVGTVLALLTTGVGLVVQSFATRALQADPRAPRFLALAALLTAATTLVALSATLGPLVVAWVVVGLALAALVGHREEWEPARRAARTTRRSLLLGDAALVAAAVLVVVAVGDLDLRDTEAAAALLAGADLLGAPDRLLVVVALLATVAGISRSALVPLHRWLPATIAAPTPVSALLHAGVVNGAGVLLVRLAPVFGASALATGLALAAGAATALYATAVMLVRSDVKGNLAWSTAGQMGFMTVQLAVGAFPAALFHLVGHGMYKAALFLGSGGTVPAHLRHHQRPAPVRPAPRPVRVAVALVVPAAALLLAYLVADPHLPLAADLLVVVFAWATAARGLAGWLGAGPASPTRAVLGGALGTVLAVVGYVAGLRLFEQYVAAALVEDVPAAVGPVPLVVVLLLAGAVAGTVALAPGERGRRLRDRTYAWLLTSAAPAPAPRVPGGPTAPRTQAPAVAAEPTGSRT